MTESKKKDGDAKKPDERKIPLRDFPDIRKFRGIYLRNNDKPVEVDSNDTPLPEGEEEDFGIRRSSDEEAWDFYRQVVCDEESDDELTEFLNDD